MNSDAITSPSSSNYVMGRTSEEYERLRRRKAFRSPTVCRPMAREGSRPRDPPLTKSSTCSNRRQKYTLGFWHVLAARGDPTSPAWEKNRLDASGYVGQATRPPRIAPRE